MTQFPTTQPKVGMSLDEFLERGSHDERFEILDGEIVYMSPQATRSSRLAKKLVILLDRYLTTQPLGEAFIETAFILPDQDNPNWVRGSRVPDVMFIRAEPLAALDAANPDWDLGPVPIVPEIVAEVVSPTDKASDVNHKVALYLQDGVRLVWVIDPQNHVVNVHRPNSDTIQKLGVEDRLSAADILPEFGLPLATLFDLA